MTTLHRAMTEHELQSAIIKSAKLRGWFVFHARPCRTEKGWRTAIEGDAGFPDLVLAKRGRVMFLECKSEKGKVSDAQMAWLDALASPQVIAEVVRPSDLDEVLRWLE